MKKLIVLLILLFALTGCRAATQMVVSQQQSIQAQYHADAERSHSEADQAQAQAEAQAATAQAQAAQTQAFAAYAAQATNAVKEAANQSKWLLAVAMFLVVGVSGFAIFSMQRVATAHPPVARQMQQLQPPQSVQLIADQNGLRPAFDGQRWLLLDERGIVVKQQKLIA